MSNWDDRQPEEKGTHQQAARHHVLILVGGALDFKPEQKKPSFCSG